MKSKKVKEVNKNKKGNNKKQVYNADKPNQQKSILLQKVQKINSHFSFMTKIIRIAIFFNQVIYLKSLLEKGIDKSFSFEDILIVLMLLTDTVFLVFDQFVLYYLIIENKTRLEKVDRIATAIMALPCALITVVLYGFKIYSSLQTSTSVDPQNIFNIAQFGLDSVLFYLQVTKPSWLHITSPIGVITSIMKIRRSLI